MNTTTKLNTLENEVRGMIIQKLEYLKNNYDSVIYGSNLSIAIFEEETANETFFTYTIESVDFIKRHTEFIGEIYNQIRYKFGSDFSNRVGQYLFDHPDRFACVIILTVANNLLKRLDIIDNCWNDEIKLDTETVNKIIKELKEL